MKPLVLLAATLLTLPSSAPATPATPAASLGDPGTASPEAVARWQDMRFGMFIHWGPVSLKGTEIGWSRGREIPVGEYDALHKRFNPTNFDASAWARTAKAAGMRYLVITSKHHDGFCLWDSEATGFDIMATPFGRDVLGELSAACRKEGIAFGTYYSTCDWHHPAFPLGSPGGRSRKPDPDLEAYDAYLQQQVTELVTKYGPLVTLWFDVPQVYGPEFGIPMVRKLRTLQPDILVNNRAYSLRGKQSGIGHQLRVGDFDTPEQRVGAYQDDRPWETCMTICRQWAWKPNDRMKSLDQCIRTLVTCAGGNGNLLFNVGPMPDGRIEPRQVGRLEEMGSWLARYGESIYGTRGGPVKPGPGYVTTRKGNTIYLHLFEDAPEEIILPGHAELPLKIVSAKLLHGGPVTVKHSPEQWSITVPKSQRQPIDTIVRIILDESAMDLEAVAAPNDFRAEEASNVFRKQAAYGAAMAFDGDPKTRWATDTGTDRCWIGSQLVRPGVIRGIEIDEAPEFSGRVESFVIRVLDNGSWKEVARGGELGAFRVKFDPVEASAICLEILKANEGPTISEIRVIR